MRRSSVVVAVVLVVAGFMGCGRASRVVGPRTFVLAVDPADYPHSESRWPDGQSITVECWGDATHTHGLDRGSVTFRTRTGERYGWTAELSPQVLRNAPGVSPVSHVFPPFDFDAAYAVALAAAGSASQRRLAVRRRAVEAARARQRRASEERGISSFETWRAVTRAESELRWAELEATASRSREELSARTDALQQQRREDALRVAIERAARAACTQ